MRRRRRRTRMTKMINYNEELHPIKRLKKRGRISTCRIERRWLGAWEQRLSALQDHLGQRGHDKDNTTCP